MIASNNNISQAVTSKEVTNRLLDAAENLFVPALPRPAIPELSFDQLALLRTVPAWSAIDRPGRGGRQAVTLPEQGVFFHDTREVVAGTLPDAGPAGS